MGSNCQKENEESHALDEEAFLSAREGYDQAELEVSGRYDKWILTLSGSALAISITFIEKIAKSPSIDTLIWLKYSWGFFVASLLIGLLSLLTSQSAIRENRKELDNSYQEGRAPRFKFPRWYTWATNFCNWGSLLAFIIGAIFLCVFSLTNIGISTQIGGLQDVRKIEKADKRKISDRGLRTPDPAENEKKGLGATPSSTTTEGQKGIKSTTEGSPE